MRASAGLAEGGRARLWEERGGGLGAEMMGWGVRGAESWASAGCGERDGEIRVRRKQGKCGAEIRDGEIRGAERAGQVRGGGRRAEIRDGKIQGTEMMGWGKSRASAGRRPGWGESKANAG